MSYVLKKMHLSASFHPHDIFTGSFVIHVFRFTMEDGFRPVIMHELFLERFRSAMVFPDVNIDRFPVNPIQNIIFHIFRTSMHSYYDIFPSALGDVHNTFTQFPDIGKSNTESVRF